MRKANKLTKCKPNGTTYTKLQKIFQKLGFITKRIKVTKSKILHYLNKNYYISIDDMITWDRDPHAMLVLQHKNGKLKIFDSYAQKAIRIQSIERTIKNSSEAFVIKPK